MKKFWQGGQSLIEVLIALGIGALVVASITVAVLAALNNAQFSKNQNLATQYAQQGMEVVRQIRNNDFALFNGYSGQFCLDQGANTLRVYPPVEGCGQNVPPFKREVKIDETCGDSSGPQKKAQVFVYWSDNKCTDEGNPFCHKAQLVSCFSDANVIPTP